jgi:cardiolipin synthase
MKDFTSNNSVELILNDSNFISTVIDIINTAKESIHLQTYIFEVDETTEPLILALNNKAAEGIIITIVLDNFGSIDFPISRLHPKVKFHFFSPIINKGFLSLTRRLHSKVLIIDSKKAIVGGINYSKKFNDTDSSKPWLDFSCLITGEEVFRLAQSLKLKPSKPSLVIDTCKVRTNINDWSRFKNQIHKSYINAIRTSTKEIIIFAPYFLPGKKFLKELKKASKRGVNIKLIFSTNSDHPLERWCSKYLYSWFLENNIAIFEWAESIVHGKMAIIDSEWVTIGSYNHNFTSQFGNHETNLEILNENFNSNVRLSIDSILKNSKRITEPYWDQQNTLKHKLIETLTYIFANVLTIILLILIFRKKENSDIYFFE